MLQRSSNARRWLVRALAISSFLYGVLLLVIWSETEHLEKTAIHNIQSLRNDNNAEQQHYGSDVVVGPMQAINTTTTSAKTGTTFQTTLKTFLDSEGASTMGIPKFTCLGWHQTGGCSPDGPRETQNDASCSTNIKAGASGYCLLKNEAGEEVQAMRVNCSSLRDEVRFNCHQAVDFVRVAPQIDALIAAKRQVIKQNEAVQLHPTNGVLMVMYPKLLASVYSTVRLLRFYNCSLPIELWYLESEMGTNPLNESRVLQSLVNEYGPISLHGIAETRVDGFNTKVFALAHSELDQVLFLDADNSPVRDPTYLFTTPTFVENGAIFWPDFWHPMNTIFNINKESLLWELVGTPYTWTCSSKKAVSY
ncbi:putative Mannosyltransferase [Phytophthora infestans]|nr:putative Mannosyltransferase [Phytophthora infestans]